MTRRRFIADEYDDERAALVGEHAAHLARVLRARVGQEFDIATGQQVRRGEIISINDDRVEFELSEEVSSPAAAPITVLLAVIKFDRFEWAVEKLTELGVAQIVPVVTARCDQHLAAAAPKRAERWQRIAREAAEQSRRGAAPEIAAPMKLDEMLTGDGARPVPADGQQHTGRIVLAETERNVTIAEALRAQRNAAAWSLLVGPEGGWTQVELGRIASAGWTGASLGPTILRAETAAIAAAAIIQALAAK
jgi:16S rRNA (uracil1498-N3)-methyltransferase